MRIRRRASLPAREGEVPPTRVRTLANGLQALHSAAPRCSRRVTDAFC